MVTSSICGWRTQVSSTALSHERLATLTILCQQFRTTKLLLDQHSLHLVRQNPSAVQGPFVLMWLQLQLVQLLGNILYQPCRWLRPRAVSPPEAPGSLHVAYESVCPLDGCAARHRPEMICTEYFSEGRAQQSRATIITWSHGRSIFLLTLACLIRS